MPKIKVFKMDGAEAGEKSAGNSDEKSADTGKNFFEIFVGKDSIFS